MEANIGDLEQQKSSYRSELFKFIRDVAETLVKKQEDGEDVGVLWNYEKPAAEALYTAHIVSMISDEETKQLCSQINNGCPMLKKPFQEGWQKSFGLM